MSETSRARSMVVGAVVVAVLITGSLVALAAGTGTVDPPPRMAFVARSDVAADALAVGPVAGRFGAPLFTTPSTSLAAEARDGLIAHGPELVVIAGGTGAISSSVEAEIKSALGLADEQVVRAAGANRHHTAALIAALIEEHSPAFLPVDATAADAALLDGAPAHTYRNPSHRTVLTSFSGLQGATSEETAKTILTLDDLPPGTYAITAQVSVTGAGTTESSTTICRVTIGDENARVVELIGHASGYSSMATFPFSVVATIDEPDSAVLACWAVGVSGSGPPMIRGGTGFVWTHLTAVRLAD